MSVGDLKTHFSEVLETVKQGNKIGILYGRIKRPIAMIVPYAEEKRTRRKLGILDGKIHITFGDTFALNPGEQERS